jgi:glucose-1-phosphate cytidylyltransferase
MLTYGDGVADINIKDLLKFHRSHGKIGTVTAVNSPGRFGELGVTSGLEVECFSEKPTGGSSISGGFFVFKREFFDYLPDDPNCVMEKAPMEKLARDGQLMAYRHTGFWQAMDTYREFIYLNELWNKGEAPWRIWA